LQDQLDVRLPDAEGAENGRGFFPTSIHGMNPEREA